MIRETDISLTEEDVKNGKRNDPENCPLVLAIRRAFPEYKSVKVHNGMVELDGETLRMHQSVADMIAEFDKTGRMEPGPLSTGDVPVSSLAVPDAVEQTRP